MGKTATPEVEAEARRLADTLFRLNVERVAAKRILRDIAEKGLTPELRERAWVFLRKHPD